MSDKEIFTFAYKFRMILWALGAIILGCGLLLRPFGVFGILMMLLPWCLLIIGLLQAASGWQQKRKRKPWLLGMVTGILMIALGITAFFKFEWRDIFLWYCFAFMLGFSGWQNLYPLRARALSRQTLWRYLGVFTVWGFVILMLFKPKSGLSDALSLLGVFIISWGVFQLLIPPPEE